MFEADTYRERAKEARDQALAASTPEIASHFRNVAGIYERLAKQAEEIAERNKTGSEQQDQVAGARPKPAV